MPESPEVDALAGELRTSLVGTRIAALDLEEYGALKTRGRALAEMAGREVTGIRRFGKHLAIETDGPTLVVSFGRAGWMRWESDVMPDAESAPVIGRLALEGGRALLITDAGNWLSLGVWIVEEPSDVPAVAKLGPDPAAPAFTSADLDGVVLGRRKQLKALLQEQESLAGIGNAYSDEILHAARLWPLAHAASLDETGRAALFTAVREVLGEAFSARRGVPIEELKAHKVAAMRVHGRAGEACPDCGGVIADIPGSKGTAQYCPACQPAP